MASSMRSRAALVAAAVSASVLAGCAATAPQPYGYAPPAVGSTWTMAYRNTGSYGKDAQLKATRGEGTWNGARAVMYALSNGTTLVADPATGHWWSVIDANGRPLSTWDPPLGPPYPLEVGKSVSTRHRVTVAATGRGSEFEHRCAVEAYEAVTVPAGTFDAYKVTCRGGAGSIDTNWISPKLGITVKSAATRNEASNFGPGTQQAELVSYDIRKERPAK